MMRQMTPVRYRQIACFSLLFVALSTIADDTPIVCQGAEFAQSTLSNPLPSLVLSGTEIISVDDFTPVKEPSDPTRAKLIEKLSATFTNKQDVNHTYYTEIGGAEIHLSVNGVLPYLTVQRQYQEAGQVVEAQVFRNVCYQDGMILAEDLLGRYVSNGLLLLEMQANTSGIPQDMWVFYPMVDAM
ncbi:hypothetical protein L4C36_15250 [Photobacterium japonica]|uniref:hypothetical protein n=1 Tax=Photobacterium japonica TaxID=2910235 RepID=UPI003D0DE7B0